MTCEFCHVPPDEERFLITRTEYWKVYLALPAPHVHWHVRPRYDHPVTFDTVEFHDQEFARHYDNRKGAGLPEATLLKVASALKQPLNQPIPGPG